MNFKEALKRITSKLKQYKISLAPASPQELFAAKKVTSETNIKEVIDAAKKYSREELSQLIQEKSQEKDSFGLSAKKEKSLESKIHALETSYELKKITSNLASLNPASIAKQVSHQTKKQKSGMEK
ncbi:MAG: hypothetical protein RLN62_05555 [Rickettsiales bacterium]